LLPLDEQAVAVQTAAVALGILGNESSARTLVDLLKDTDAAQRLLGKTEVPYRTRAFAGYGLGLLARESPNNELRQEIARHLIDVLEAPHFATRDIKVAAMTALGLTPLATAGTGAGPASDAPGVWVASRETQLAFLLDYFDQANARANKSTRHWFVRAHAPTAMARLLDGAPAALRAPVAELLLDAVGRHSKERQELRQSATLALGQIGTAGASLLDARIRAELTRLIKDGLPQERRFALISLAQVGSRPGVDAEPWAGHAEVRNQLVRQMSRGKSQLKPWAALALGVFGRASVDHDLAPDPTTAAALKAAARAEKSPDAVGAYLLALGLRRDAEGADVCLEKLDTLQGSDEARGHAAVALGLIGQRSAIKPIQEVVRASSYRQDLLKEAAIGLGLLGDKDMLDELIVMLENANSLPTQASLATALGVIGDSRSIDPLIAMLEDEDLTATARGFACVALGIVCDDAPLPWNSAISVNINYRANTTTLTSVGLGTGILDIL